MKITNSVIICTRNRLNDITRCIVSLSKQIILPTEIIVVDSSDCMLINCKKFCDVFNSDVFKNVKLVYKHTKPGLTIQRNIGIKLARFEVIYFFDDDVVLEPSYIKEMNIVFEFNPQYGGGMGTVTNGLVQPSIFYLSFRRLFFLQQDYSNGFFTLSGMPTHAYGTNKFKEVEVLGGCCFAFRRKILKKHLFDESFKGYAYMEDSDISKRISDCCRLFFNPKARLQHFHSSVCRDKILENRAMYIRNYSYLFFKYFYSQNKLRFFAYLWSIIGLFIEAILFRRFQEMKGYIKGLKIFYKESK